MSVLYRMRDGKSVLDMGDGYMVRILSPLPDGAHLTVAIQAGGSAAVFEHSCAAGALALARRQVEAWRG